jgi:hypothetical protein
VSGLKVGELVKHDGKTVTATGKVSEDESGGKVIEVRDFTVTGNRSKTIPTANEQTESGLTSILR